MKRVEFWLRMVAYAGGLGGAAIVWWSDPSGPLRPVGLVMLIAMFVAFVAAHFLRLVLQWKGIHKPGRPMDPLGRGRRDSAPDRSQSRPE